MLQFLPSTYRDTGTEHREDEERRAANAQLRSTRPQARNNRQQSSLIIQHRFPSKATSKRMADSFRQRDQSVNPSENKMPPPPSFRLLSNDVARVLCIDSPATTLHRTLAASRPPARARETLRPTNVLQNLRVQADQQSAAILRDLHSAQQLDSQRHVAMVEENRPQREKANIVHAIQARGGAESLYTGIAIAAPPSRPRPQSSGGVSGSMRTRSLAQASSTTNGRAIPRKHGRHWKTELVFPQTTRLGAP